MSAPTRFTLRRVYLNKGGYEYGRVGRYFGIGAPLYRYASDDGDTDGYLRAGSRSEARAIVADRHAGAVFYR
jgi:hypothetical protein